jgi:hypothetical protein
MNRRENNATCAGTRGVLGAAASCLGLNFVCPYNLQLIFRIKGDSIWRAREVNCGIKT